MEKRQEMSCIVCNVCGDIKQPSKSVASILLQKKSLPYYKHLAGKLSIEN